MYKPGQWKAICDVCGFEFFSGEMKKRWDGLMVCAEDWETDHPQKYIRVPSDPKPVPWVRSEPADVFVAVCTRYTQQGIAGIGVAGCMVAGQNNNLAYTEYNY